MKGTRKMRNSVSEVGRFQISLSTSSRAAGAGTTTGLAGAETAGAVSVGCTDMQGSGATSFDVQNTWNIVQGVDIPSRAAENLGPTDFECESGGTGRRAGFRSQWLTAVGVRVPPFAPLQHANWSGASSQLFTCASTSP